MSSDCNFEFESFKRCAPQKVINAGAAVCITPRTASEIDRTRSARSVSMSFASTNLTARTAASTLSLPPCSKSATPSPSTSAFKMSVRFILSTLSFFSESESVRVSDSSSLAALLNKSEDPNATFTLPVIVAMTCTNIPCNIPIRKYSDA